MTRQRAVVLEVIRSDMCHHTAEEIFHLARLRLPSISRATVYNNLRALEEERIIRRISGDGAADRYDNAYEPHGHIVCPECGAVKDFFMDGFAEALRRALGTEVDSYELKARVVCDRCKLHCVGS
ncbi:MAG: transcriptional repressor [Clostridia bacterium]|nr:transcriptional repressor [Clostridia bacterium]